MDAVYIEFLLKVHFYKACVDTAILSNLPILI